MKDLARLEDELADVVSLDDLAGDAVDTLQRLTGASGALVFIFDTPLVPRVVGGSLATAMQGYTADLFQEDWVQSQCLSHPEGTYLTTDGGDWAVHSRSRPYADFYRRHDVGFMKGVWPCAAGYGTRGMFGILLTKPKLHERFDSRVCRLLEHIERPLRAAARRIERSGEISRERDVLRHLLGASRGAFALWDPEQRLAWVSPEAEPWFRQVPVRGRLHELAAIGARRSKLAPSASGRDVLGRCHELVAATGEQVVVQWFRVRGPDQRPWLLAELRAGHDFRARLAALTPAERRVLRLLARGSSNHEIGGELFVSAETVKTHVSRILRKLGVSSRAKAARLAHDAGLTRSPLDGDV